MSSNKISISGKMKLTDPYTLEITGIVVVGKFLKTNIGNGSGDINFDSLIPQEILDWCEEYLKGNCSYGIISFSYNDDSIARRFTFDITIAMQFSNEADTVMFRLKWL